MERLPVFLNLTDRHCLVVGGGTVAERKVRLLQRANATISVLSPTLNVALQSITDEGGITHIRNHYQREFDGHYWLVIAATDDDDLNRQVGADAEHNGTLCNVVDDNAASTFILPAIVDRSPVVIAIGTEGNAPVLAQQLKGQIEQWLPQRIGALAAQAGRWRDLVKKRFATLRLRRRFWQAFFTGPIAGHLLAGRQREAEDAMRAELIGDFDESAATAGEAWIIGAGPGDPGLITLRGQQLLARADVILYDRLVSQAVLDFARKEAEFIFVGKRAGAQAMPTGGHQRATGGAGSSRSTSLSIEGRRSFRVWPWRRRGQGASRSRAAIPDRTGHNSSYRWRSLCRHSAHAQGSVG